jgi:hypothetical protein
MGINPPLYTLEQLAEMIGVSLDTLRRVARAYPSYFIKIAGRTIIRASRLDELLELHEGGEIATRSMTQESREALALRRRELVSQGSRP